MQIPFIFHSYFIRHNNVKIHKLRNKITINHEIGKKEVDNIERKFENLKRKKLKIRN